MHFRLLKFICLCVLPSTEGDKISMENIEVSVNKACKTNLHIWIAGDVNLPGYDWKSTCLEPNCHHLPWVPEVVSHGIGLEYRFRPASAKREQTGRRPGASVKPRRERSEQGAERDLRFALAGLKQYSKPIPSKTTSGTQVSHHPETTTKFVEVLHGNSLTQS